MVTVPNNKKLHNQKLYCIYPAFASPSSLLKSLIPRQVFKVGNSQQRAGFHLPEPSHILFVFRLRFSSVSRSCSFHKNTGPLPVEAPFSAYIAYVELLFQRNQIICADISVIGTARDIRLQITSHSDRPIAFCKLGNVSLLFCPRSQPSI